MKIVLKKEHLGICGNCKKQTNCNYPIQGYTDGQDCDPVWNKIPKINRVTGATIEKNGITIEFTEDELKQLQFGLYDKKLTDQEPMDHYVINQIVTGRYQL